MKFIRFFKVFSYKNHSNYKNALNSMSFLEKNLSNRDEQQDVGGVLVELAQEEIRRNFFFNGVHWNFKVQSFKVL